MFFRLASTSLKAGRVPSLRVPKARGNLIDRFPFAEQTDYRDRHVASLLAMTSFLHPQLHAQRVKTSRIEYPWVAELFLATPSFYFRQLRVQTPGDAE